MQTASPPLPLRERARRFYQEHEPACTAGLFVAGFLFDTMAVGRIDRLHNIIHQATYLLLCALFISLELRESYAGFSPPRRLEAAWRYHKGATHFMLGTLLNIYTLSPRSSRRSPCRSRRSGSTTMSIETGAGSCSG